SLPRRAPEHNASSPSIVPGIFRRTGRQMTANRLSLRGAPRQRNLAAASCLPEALPMPNVQPFPAGGYRFLTHAFQYSGGVAAEPGFRIERARFAGLLPLAQGFDAVEQ